MRHAVFVLALLAVGCHPRRHATAVAVTRLMYEAPPARVLGDHLDEPSVEPLLAEQQKLLQGDAFRRRSLPGDDLAHLDMEVRRIKNAPILELVFYDSDHARALRLCRLVVQTYLAERGHSEGARASVLDGCAPVVLSKK